MQAWEAPTRPRNVKKAAKVSVVVAKNGRVLSSKITDKSGDEELDGSVRKVLERVKSLQPFEDGAKDERRTVTVTFKLNS
jgi:TonB family protein